MGIQQASLAAPHLAPFVVIKHLNLSSAIEFQRALGALAVIERSEFSPDEKLEVRDKLEEAIRHTRARKSESGSYKTQLEVHLTETLRRFSGSPHVQPRRRQHIPRSSPQYSS